MGQVYSKLYRIEQCDELETDITATNNAKHEIGEWMNEIQKIQCYE